MQPSPPRLLMLDALRGLAALGVTWFHLTAGNSAFLPEGFLKSSGAYGWLGVEIFFVISGFIIPYTLYQSKYRVSSYGTFILKRIIRLDPPYLVAILVIIALNYASSATPGFKGPHFEFSFIQVLLHLGYVNVFFGYPWLNPVFWTLAIELQYYLLVGLLFSAIAHQSLWVRGCAFACLAGFAFLVPQEQFLFHWLFLFMLGMTAFQLRVGMLQRPQFLIWIVLLGLGAYYINNLVIAIAGLTTALLLGLGHIRANRLLLFFGHISYSLYLIHVPVGSRVINLGQRFAHTLPERLAVLALALAICTAAAWLLYFYVERPAQQWSSGIRYRNK